MRLNWRTVAALVILAFSLTLLVWGFWPSERERRILPVDPSNLTLPTPASLLLLPLPA
jgi:hypothetical protein